MTGSITTRTTWLIALTGAFVLALSLADVAATKFILVGGVVAPGGIFLFSVIFVVRDMLHRVAGQEYVKRTILIAAGLNLLMGLYLWMIARFPSPAFYELAEPWARIFTLAPGIVLGSITAAVVSQLVNTWIYQRLWDRGAPLWWRVIGSNLVSLPVDSIIFTFLAFVILPPIFGGTPIALAAAIARIVGGQTLLKAIIMLVMTPFVYLTPGGEKDRPG
jgi:queuosine precursor transporter